jgi:hypothetical protein
MSVVHRFGLAMSSPLLSDGARNTVGLSYEVLTNVLAGQTLSYFRARQG